MLRDLVVDDIFVDDVPAIRECRAARLMGYLLRRFPALTAIVLALQWRGNDRVLRPGEASILHPLIARRGRERAWRMALISGFFLHRDLPVLPLFAFDLNAMSDTDCRNQFRFDHAGIKRLVVLLQLPAVLFTPHPHGDRFSAIEGVCLLLDRLSYPRSLLDLRLRYDRFPSALSRITTYMLHLVLAAAEAQILFSKTSNPARINTYVDAFRRQGVPEQLRVWSVIDVKKVAYCRPSHDQRAQFSGHKKLHCLKYQTLESPDGLIVHCFRCADGRRGDGYILRSSNLLPFLNGNRDIMRNHNVVFGDSAYPNNNVMVTMFRGRNLPAWASAFNKRMAKVRVNVEWGYAQVTQNFAFADWDRQLRIESMPVESIWLLAVVFTNCLTCHWGRNQISDYFHCYPPSLDEYLDGINVTID